MKDNTILVQYMREARERSQPTIRNCTTELFNFEQSQGSVTPLCNGETSPWTNCLPDHS